MLVLTRRPGEAIVIDSEIIVRVLEVRGEQVRVGIEAPHSVVVHREEVQHELAQANSTPPFEAARPPRSDS